MLGEPQSTSVNSTIAQASTTEKRTAFHEITCTPSERVQSRVQSHRTGSGNAEHTALGCSASHTVFLTVFLNLSALQRDSYTVKRSVKSDATNREFDRGCSTGVRCGIHAASPALNVDRVPQSTFEHVGRDVEASRP